MSSAPPVADEPQPKGNKRALLVAFVTIFLDLLGFGVMIPIAPFYAEHFGASPAAVTLLGSVYSVMQFLFAPLWGRLSDRIGRRPVVLISISFACAAYVITGIAGSFAVLVVSRALAGFGNANLGTVQAIIADVTPPKDRAKGMGLIGAAFGLGFIFGPVIGGVVGGAYGAPAAAFVSAALCGINWLLAVFLLKETRTASSTDAAPRGIFSLGALGRARKLKNVGVLLLIALIYSWGFSLMESALALFVEHTFVPYELLKTDDGQKMATRLTTWVLLVVGATAVVVQGGLIGPLRRRFGERTLISGGAALVAVGFALTVAVPLLGNAGYAMLLGLMVVIALGSGVLSPSQSSLLSRAAPADEQGVILSLGQSMGAFGRILGPAIAGFLFEEMHTGPFVVGALLIAIAAGIALKLDVTEA